MTGDKGSEVMTPSKEKREKELNLSELGSSLLGSFQSLQSSQSSEEDKMVLDIPSLGETRVLQFEDTLSEEDHRKFDLIYKLLLLEGKAGNLTNLTLEMVLAEKLLTWLQVMHERIKHLIISSDTFREKKRTDYNTQVRGKGHSKGKGVGKHSKGVKILKDGRQFYGKGSKPKITPGNNQRSSSTIGIHSELFCLFEFSTCIDFCVLLLFHHMGHLCISNISVGREVEKWTK